VHRHHCQSRVSTNVGFDRRSPPSRHVCDLHYTARTERGEPIEQAPARQSRLSALLTTPSDALRLSNDDTQDGVGGDRDRVCHRPHHRHPTLGIEVSTASMPHPNFPRKKVHREFSSPVVGTPPPHACTEGGRRRHSRVGSNNSSRAPVHQQRSRAEGQPLHGHATSATVCTRALKKKIYFFFPFFSKKNS
jgi:hypothetical protein